MSGWSVDPDRWHRLNRRDAHFIPFGVTANRACPARLCTNYFEEASR